MKINTTPGETYIVLSTGGCTVTTGAGKQIKKLAAGQDFFTAMTGDSILSDDNASVTVAKGEILSLLNTDGTGAEVQATLRFQPVTSQSALPTTGENGVIYLVPNTSTAPNQYTEWVWTGAAYEQLGDASVDLSGYAKKSELATDVQQAFSNRTFEVYRLSVNSGGASIDGLTIFNPMGGPGSKLTTDDGIVQNSESFSNQHLVIHTDAMVKGGLNAKSVVTSDLRAVGSVDLSKCTLVGTLGNGSWNYDSLRVSDFGHPLAIYADGEAIGAMWVEASHVQALLDVETPVLKAPEGEMSVMCSLRLCAHKNPDGGTEVPALIAPLVECDTLSAMRILTEHLGSSGTLMEAGSLYLQGGLLRFTKVSEVTTCYISSGCTISGPGWDETFEATYTRLGLGSDTDTGTAAVPLAERVLTPTYDNRQIYIGPGHSLDNMTTGYPRFISYQDVTHADNQFVEIEGSFVNVHGRLEVSDAGSLLSVTNMATLTLGEGSTISGPGWEAIVADIQSGAASSAVAALVEPEQPSFTKLIFPPTGTATAEQDPSWITKSNILMETNGGQLNMTQLTATLAYAAQTPLAIAKRTLWLSTSSGTGDAVQWPANAVFPDDQPQDKIQQLNSNSTYWFDITYVGGSDTVLIRKVCSWAATTGESGPTE